MSMKYIRHLLKSFHLLFSYTHFGKGPINAISVAVEGQPEI